MGPMNLEIANLFVAAISALSSLVHAYKTARDDTRQVKESRITELESRGSRPLKRGGKAIGNVIDQNLLSALTRNIGDSIEKLGSVLRDAEASEQVKDAAMKEAEERVCGSLRRILMLNQNHFPTKTLQNLWLSHGCENSS
jgi:hypothetical protein